MALRALCIGINDYPGTGSDLAGCVNDAHDWASVLKKRGFGVTKLLDRKATGAAIRKSIGTLLSRSYRGDLAVITYSGHGSFVPDRDGDEPDGVDECLCPHDVRARGVVTDDALHALFAARPAGVRVVMVADSCHSGTVARFAPISVPVSERGGSHRRTVRFLPPGSYLSRRASSRLGARRGRVRASAPGRHAALLMSGCQDTEYSYDGYFGGRPNGAFTYVALKALAKLKKTATYKDWYAAIRKALPSRQHPQTPNIYGSSSMKAWKVLK